MYVKSDTESLMIKYICDNCGKECRKDCDLMGSEYDTYHKLDDNHICVDCYNVIVNALKEVSK